MKTTTTPSAGTGTRLRRALTLGAAVATFAAGLIATAPTVAAQSNTFACDPGFYQVISGQLAELDPHNGVYTTIGPDGSSYNAMAYRQADGYMYAISGTTLLRVDATGARTTVGTLNMPGNSYTGDFGDDGLLHVSRGGQDWYKINVDTLEATAVPELSVSVGAADITNVHGVFQGVSGNGALVTIDPVAGTAEKGALIAGLPTTSKSYGAAWSTAGGNFYVGRNSGEIYQITGYTTSSPTATQVGSAPATNSNDGGSCALAAPPAGLDDVDGPEPERAPSTPESQAAADSYTANWDTISAGFTPAGSTEPQPAETVSTSEPENTYAVDDAGMGTGATCANGPDEDRLPRSELLAMAQVSTPTTLYTTNFDGASARDFTILSGSWNETGGALEQLHTCGYDYTALLEQFYVEDFRWEATYHGRSAGNQAGVIFNQSDRHTRSGAMAVDLTDNGSTLRWGSYDDRGYYVPIGSAPVTAPATGVNVTLVVEVHGTDVAITLDGAPIATVTAPNAGGMVGLIASLTDVGFDTVTLTALPANS